MAFTQEEIKAMEPKALEVELAIALFGFRWWSEMGVTRYLLDPNVASKYVFKKSYVWDEAAATLPLAPLAFSGVPWYTTWENMPLVVAAMIAQGWQWSASCGDNETDRVIFGKIDKDERGKDRSIRVRLIDCQNLESVPIVTCQVALWALQPWANNEIAWITEFPDLAKKSGFNEWERANNLQ